MVKDGISKEQKEVDCEECREVAGLRMGRLLDDMLFAFSNDAEIKEASEPYILFSLWSSV